MNQFVIGFVRGFYMLSLLLSSFIIASFVLVSRAAAASGNSSNKFFWQFLVAELLLFILLLASTVLEFRSKNWFLLGLPTVLILYAFLGYLGMVILFRPVY